MLLLGRSPVTGALVVSEVVVWVSAGVSVVFELLSAVSVSSVFPLKIFLTWMIRPRGPGLLVLPSSA